MNTALIHLLLLCSVSGTCWQFRSLADIEAKIVYVDAKNGFVVINKGKAGGLGSDHEYEVVRKVGNQTMVVGTGRFEKYLGRDTMCKLIIDDGTVQQMQIDDIVLCRRKG